MPTDATNGLTSFSLHATEDASGTIDQLREESAASIGLAAEDAGGSSAVNPETAARRFLSQALESASVPSLAAPEAAGATSRFKAISTETIPLTGTNIVKFRQTLHDIPVYGSLVAVELDESNALVSLESTLGTPEGVDPVASVSPAQARAVAESAPDGYTPTSLDAVPKLHYYFDTQASAWRLVYILEDVPVTLDRSDDSAGDGQRPLEPPRFVDYVIDAHDETVVAVLPRTPSVASGEEQTALDAFGVERTFLASKNDDGNLVLVDPVHNVETYDFGFKDPTTTPGLPGDDITYPPDWTPAAVSGHANAAAVSDYMRTVLLRNNIDDQGGAMVSTINCVVVDADDGPQEWHNAFWTGQLKQMVYGQVRRGEELRTLAANIDVVAHEMFHGVTDSTARLEYHVQSGAMNESYSDIFGTIVANRGNDDPRTWDWNLGENLFVGDEPLRDLSNPPRFGDPAHMDDFVVKPDDRGGDWGGVHTNSGIHNKAAYNLLTAENEDGTLTLTADESAAVFYLALTQRLSRTSQFIDSRRAAVTSARSLFRNLPTEELERKVAAVEKAFEDVGIR
jgi:Zn-dependent metalloprotease